MDGLSTIKVLLDRVNRPGLSDIHLKAGESPLVRYLGKLTTLGGTPLSADDLKGTLSSLLDERQQKDFDETGNVDFSLSLPSMGRVRVNAYRQKGTVAIAMRLIPLESRTFTELHLQSDVFEKLTVIDRGLVLITGVTGAGKTTTLNAILHQMNETQAYNIVTLEDPIEFFHLSKKSSVSQREVGRDVSSITEGMKYVMRQDPDVIVIGEMRHADAYQSAIDAASSGHLVLATVHGADVLDSVDRIVNSFESTRQNYARTQLTNVIRAVVSLRLTNGMDGKSLFPATEILFGTLQMRKLLQMGNPMEVKYALEKGNAFGMHTFDQDLMRLFEEGHIAPSEVLTHATFPNDVRLKLQGQTGSADLLQ